MTILTFINKLRCELRDNGTLRKDVWDGDASTLNFPASTFPILEDSYTVKVDGTTKTETTDYSLDKDTGLLSFVSAPVSGSDNVEMSYKAVKFRDNDFLEIINDAIDYFMWKFWKETLDTTTFTTVKNQYEYDLSSISNILYVVNAWYKTASGSTVWQAIQGLTNWKYYPQQNKLYVNPPFSSSSLPMKIFYLAGFTKGTATSDTLDVPTRYLLPYKYYCYSRFFERLGIERMNEIGAITTHPYFMASPNVLNVAELYMKKADLAANKICPKLPPMMIAQSHEGVII